MPSTRLSPGQLRVGGQQDPPAGGTLPSPLLPPARCTSEELVVPALAVYGGWSLVLEVCQPSAPIPRAARARAGLLALLLSTKTVVGEELRELVLRWTILFSPPQGIPGAF